MVSCISQKKIIYIGVVDNIDEKICEVQLVNEEIIYLDSKICDSLKEGDEIKVLRPK
tara:strand:+ start:1198 stop:1368 length:171 start_codon:yes stop_codon:yes gene_type:complete